MKLTKIQAGNTWCAMVRTPRSISTVGPEHGNACISDSCAMWRWHRPPVLKIVKKMWAREIQRITGSTEPETVVNSETQKTDFDLTGKMESEWFEKMSTHQDVVKAFKLDGWTQTCSIEYDEHERVLCAKYIRDADALATGYCGIAGPILS